MIEAVRYPITLLTPHGGLRRLPDANARKTADCLNQ